jgi:YVTN family beta-propeller protein
MADVPSGAVTFLFTDIEGSTRLVKQLRDGYPAVLSEHQRLLRAAFAAHGGYEVDTQGDSFFVAFSSAREALLAAVEGQLALHSYAWPEGVEIKVRMGLHTGQAVASDGRYTGLAVHRAARIGAASHGGQILVSQATQTLLEDEEEDLHVFLRDLGEQRLKDLDRPVRLYQAAADGLRASFPPVRGDAHLAQAAEVAIAPPFWRRRRGALAAVAVALLCVAVLAAALLVQYGSSGGLGEIQANHVGLIDPQTNDIVAEVPVGIRPGPIAAGDGSIWVGNLDDRTLTRIDVAQRVVSATVSLDDKTPTGIAVGAGGVWVAHGFLGEVARVDPQFNRVAATIDVASPVLRTGSVAVGDGLVWAAFGDSTLARIDPARTGPPETGFAGVSPSALVVASGAVWVANAGDSTVQRFNPATFQEGAVRPISVGSRPTAIAFGEGALWVANTFDDSITRIDPANAATRTIGVGVGPTAVAVGAGAVWVANASDRTISRVDPTTKQVVETIDVGNMPAGVVFSGGFVWVTAQAP